MPTILFLCTGNYYRSRFAEHWFNELARREKLAWRADSRGLRIHVANPGPMSQRALRELESLGVPSPDNLRYPMPASVDDFAAATHIVAVKEAEHRPLMLESFPQFLSRVEFWEIHDLDAATPDEALPLLAERVRELVARLAIVS